MSKYPGWQRNLRYVQQNNIGPLGEEGGLFPMGIHYTCYGCESPLLTVREVAMMLVMERLTDKPDWHVKILDQSIVDKWTEEALAWPNGDLWNRISNLVWWEDGTSSNYNPRCPDHILDKPSIEFAIMELQQKARYFQRTGIIPTLDANHSVAKSDTIVPEDLHVALRSAFDRLKADQASHPDWHPNTNETVQDLVHPSMYPLVYGRSLFLPEEVVGVEDAVEKWAGTGDAIPQPTLANFSRNRGIGNNGDPPDNYWSDTYQWLPANLKFKDEGGVKFTSYINNLHPARSEIYTAIEQLVEVALPLWDQCLKRYIHSGKMEGPGRLKPRIQCKEVE